MFKKYISDVLEITSLSGNGDDTYLFATQIHEQIVYYRNNHSLSKDEFKFSDERYTEFYRILFETIGCNVFSQHSNDFSPTKQDKKKYKNINRQIKEFKFKDTSELQNKEDSEESGEDRNYDYILTSCYLFFTIFCKDHCHFKKINKTIADVAKTEDASEEYKEAKQKLDKLNDTLLDIREEITQSDQYTERTSESSTNTYYSPKTQAEIDADNSLRRFRPKNSSKDEIFHEDNVEYVGRKKELKLFEDFIDCKEKSEDSLLDASNEIANLKVWAISGTSGAGKTRLSHQWMKQSKKMKGWEQIVFSHNTDPFKEYEKKFWEEWQPKFNTLIVIDYLYVYHEIFNTILTKCHFLDHNSQLSKKVRILLVDHVFPDNLRKLQEDKRFLASEFSYGELENIYFKQSPLDLNKTDDQDVIIKEIIRNSITKADSKIENISGYITKSIDYLKSLENAYNPLFAVLIVDTIKNDIKSGRKPDFEKLNRRQLIQTYLKNNKRLPWKDNKNSPDTYQSNQLENSLASLHVAVATARRGVEYDLICELLPKKFEAKEIQDDKVYQICTHILSVPEFNTHLPPYEPDILGESFFLILVNDLFRRDSKLKSFKNVFIQMLFAGDEKGEARINDAKDFIGFVIRLVRNLCNDNQEDQIVKDHWQALFKLFEAFKKHSEKGKLMEFTVQCALVETLEILDKFVNKNDQYKEEYLYHYKKEKKALDEDIIFSTPNIALIGQSLHLCMKYLKQYHKNEEMPPQLLLSASEVLEKYKNSKNNKHDWGKLHLACYFGNKQLCEFLLIQGEQIESRASNKFTPLMIASYNGHIDVVKHLLDNDANIEARDNNDSTPLMLASSNGHIEVVKHLLNNDSEIEARDNNDSTPLMLASDNGHIEVVKHLLDHDTNIEAKSKDGWTSLMLASSSDHIDLVKHLLDKDANIEAKTKNGWTSLMLASSNDHIDLVKHLLDKDANIEAKETNNITSLMLASRNSHIEVVKHLLDNNADIEAKTKNGWTSLMLASDNGHIEVVKYLLNNDAKIESKSEYDLTSLMLASSNGHIEVVKYLLNNDSEIEARDNNDWTSLMLASDNGHLKIVKHLLDNHAEIEATSTDGWTSLMLASSNGHSEVVKYLLDHDANIEANEINNVTSLMIASRNGHIEVVKYLLDNGANIEVKEANNNITSLMIASYNGHIDVVKYLLDNHANIEAKSKDGWTSLMLASNNGHDEVVKYLLDNGAKF